ncbi:unnamed protein product [Boreogadus saida]
MADPTVRARCCCSCGHSDLITATTQEDIRYQPGCTVIIDPHRGVGMSPRSASPWAGDDEDAEEEEEEEEDDDDDDDDDEDSDIVVQYNTVENFPLVPRMYSASLKNFLGHCDWVI